MSVADPAETAADAKPVHEPEPAPLMVQFTVPPGTSVSATGKLDVTVADSVIVVPTSAPVATIVVAAGFTVTVRSVGVEVGWLE
ncbi:MAG: hypothetical protein WBO97_04575 [Tepidiformaceae bacterium]